MIPVLPDDTKDTNNTCDKKNLPWYTGQVYRKITVTHMLEGHNVSYARGTLCPERRKNTASQTPEKQCVPDSGGTTFPGRQMNIVSQMSKTNNVTDAKGMINCQDKYTERLP